MHLKNVTNLKKLTFIVAIVLKCYRLFNSFIYIVLFLAFIFSLFALLHFRVFFISWQLFNSFFILNLLGRHNLCFVAHLLIQIHDFFLKMYGMLMTFTFRALCSATFGSIQVYKTSIQKGPYTSLVYRYTDLPESVCRILVEGF